MRDQPENIMLVSLRRLDAKMDRLAEDVTDIKHHLITVGTQVGQFASNEARHHVSLAIRFDRLASRIDRIERRLDIVTVD